MTSDIVVKNYRRVDIDAVIDIFQRAVREVASRDYAAGHVAAWSAVDRAEWAEWRLTRPAWVARVGGRPAGFADLEPDGHLDMMFVHPEFQRIGVATALLGHLEDYAERQGLRTLHAEVSITGQPFFLRRGFRAVRPDPIVIDGLSFARMLMEKPL